MADRRPLSPMRKLRLFEDAGGICHLCEQKIHGKWDVEHIIPLALGGADDETNMAPAHKACHAPKTAQDVADIARAKRRKARHLGIRKPSTWQTKWKRKLDGTTVLR